MAAKSSGTVFYIRAMTGFISSWGAAAASFFETFNPLIRGVGLILGAAIAAISLYKMVRDWNEPVE